VTASSVYAICYMDGVMLACDSGAFQGGTSRYKGVNRLYRLNSRCVLAFSGDWADFQFIQNLVERRQIKLQHADPDLEMTPKMVQSYLCMFFYSRRSKLDPLWDTIVVAGR